MYVKTMCTALMLLLGIGGKCLTVYAEPEKLIPTEILASSTLLTSEFGDYGPKNLMDNDLSAAWVENAQGDGCGESVTFLFPENTVITGIDIVTGYCKNEDIFYKNSAPSLLACYSTEGACYIDLSDLAADYSLAKEGLFYEFQEPLEADGSITFFISAVRQGWKYADTCISELHVYGYQGTEEDSMVKTVPIENFLRDELSWLSQEASWIYKSYTKHILQELSLEQNQLSPENKAFLAYWYQYMRSDDGRLIFDNNVNRASVSDMKDIIEEMFGSCEQEDIDVFLSRYILAQEGENLVMNAVGDFGDAGEFIFGEPVMIAEEDQIRLEGIINAYDSQTNAYVPQKIYSAWFTLEPVGTEKIHTFIRMETKNLN